MLPFSGINQNINNVPSPSEHFAIGYVHNDNFPLGNIAFICHSKQFQEGLMVFSADFLCFLKIRKNVVEFTKTYLVALKGKFSSGTEFYIIFKPPGNCMIFQIKYNFVILELIGQPYFYLKQNNSKNV